MENAKKIIGYKKKPTASLSVVGMLHIVEVRMVTKGSGEKIKQKLLLVGCEAADIERKIKWLFDVNNYEQFSVVSVEKVREKVHVLSTVITDNEVVVSDATIKRSENTQEVFGASGGPRGDSRRLFAVGVTTTILANDENHAVRKVGKALMARGGPVASVEGPKLSADSNVQVEEMSMSSGFSKSRDVSSQINKAHFVRG